jgi:hypothetical protein
MYASPSNNYWLVGDQDPATRWSSAAVAYVADTDTNYVNWLADGYETSQIATEQELADLLNATYPAGSPIPIVPVPIPGTGPGPIYQQLIQAPVTTGVSSTFTVPAGVQRLVLWGQAAGGGGQSVSNGGASQTGRQAGGPGETRRMILDVTPGDVLSYSIGAEGAGGLATPAGSNNNGGTAADLTIGTSATSYPVAQATAVGESAGSAATENVPLPAGIVAGDLLLLLFRGGNTSVATPAGWTSLYNNIVSVGPRGAIFYKIASGAEGAAVALTQGVAGIKETIAYRITGHDPAVAPEFATVVNNTNAPNPPSLTPSWGSKRTLWFAVGLSNALIKQLPSNYHNEQQGTGRGFIKSAQRELQASTENPGAYACAPDSWIAFTLAVKPLVVPTLLTCKGGVGGAGGDTPPAAVPAGGNGGIVIPPTNPGAGWSNNSISASIGGSTIFGQATPMIVVGARAGLTGGPGSGGGGGIHATAVANAGGAGGVGLILIEGYGASSA